MATIFLSQDDDDKQDSQIGDFRACAKQLVGQKSVLEIGSGYSPLFLKRDGFDVSIVDHADQAGLIAKYKAMGVDTSNIESVDYVWQGGAISELLGDKTFDVIYASHVIEHMTDITRFLADCCEIINDDGRIVLIVPDKRYCFDLFQPLSDVGKVLSDYRRAPSTHSFASFYGEEMQVSAKYSGDDLIAWWQGEVDSIKFMHSSPRERFASAIASCEMSEYRDAHEYYFTPSSFFLIVEELRYLGLINLEVETLTRSRGCEFLSVLKKSFKSNRTEDQFLKLRFELSLNILREQSEVSAQIISLRRPFDCSDLF